MRFLFVDRDPAFAEAMGSQFAAKRAEVGAQAPEPTFAESIRLAQQKLSDREYSYGAIFVDPAIGSPAWIAVVRTAHQYREGTPVLVLYSKHPGIKKEEAMKLGVAGFIKKPISYGELYDLLCGGQESGASPEAEAPGAGTDTEAPGAETDTDTDGEADAGAPALGEPELLKVDLSNISGRHPSQFDLYVKLSNGRYVRILRHGDVLSRDRIESYRAKGVTELYIPRSAHEKFMAFLDSMVGDLVKDATISIDVKTTEVARQGAATLGFLKESGFSEKSIVAAQQYVTNTTEIVRQLATTQGAIKKLLDDVTTFEHSVAVSTLAALLIKHIGGQNPGVFNAVGIACFLHDIALLGQPQVFFDDDEAALTPGQKELYYAHPEAGAEIVKKMKQVPPIVVKAVAQHHLRLGKGGFPKDKADDEVNRIGELIGVCEEFLKLMRQASLGGPVNPFDGLMARADKEFSEPIVDAFVRAFQSK